MTFALASSDATWLPTGIDVDCMVALLDSIGLPAVVISGEYGQRVMTGARLDQMLPAPLQRELCSHMKASLSHPRHRAAPRQGLVFQWRGWQVRRMDLGQRDDRPLVVGLLEALPSVAGLGGRLTPRQLQVAKAAAAGESVPEFAARFGISRHTVRRHLEEVHRRLGISRRAELVRLLGMPGALGTSSVAS